jgi:hypothetical protein
MVKIERNHNIKNISSLSSLLKNRVSLHKIPVSINWFGHVLIWGGGGGSELQQSSPRVIISS